MKCLTWNLEWAVPASKRVQAIVDEITKIDPDVGCYTEIVRNMMPHGHCIEANADYGYRGSEGQRKVILWSKLPWTDVDAHGSDELPSGRFVTGVSHGIRFVGICIPWRDAHVRTGRRDRRPWEDHLSYCAALGKILRHYGRYGEPICLVGDYNQRIPRGSQPLSVYNALTDAIPSEFQIPTAGMKSSEGEGLIDHFATSPILRTTVDAIIQKSTNEGLRLSDHAGASVSIHIVNSERRDGPDRHHEPLSNL